MTDLDRVRLDMAQLLFDSAGRIQSKHIAEPGELLTALMGIVERATKTKPLACHASADIGVTGSLGPCVLRFRHDGPVHEDATGARWWSTVSVANSTNRGKL